jgi:Subtilase family
MGAITMARSTRTVSSPPGPKPELIAIAKQSAALRARPAGPESLAGAPVSDMSGTLAKYGASMTPLFGPSEERVISRSEGMESMAAAPLPDLSVFYKIDAPENKLEELREALASDPLLEAAYIKPAVEMPDRSKTDDPKINTMAPSMDIAPPASPDFTAGQIYLNPAPEGVDARWAWTRAGGRGGDIRIIDIEGAWRFTHEDLTGNQGGVLGGTPIDGVDWRNHGTAVLGEYSGDVNGIGVTGICSDAIASAVSHWPIGSAAAINIAASRLHAGDLMLLEMHRPGPRFNFQVRGDQRGYIAVEWWPDDYAAILNATRQGIIVVEAAGNGAEDLDDVLYEQRPAGFPATWTNSFHRSNRDSGAVVVGAGAPPPGTHGQNHGPDRSRLGFSNWGALIDAQGWGREVTTCGYGDLQGGSDEDLWYTDHFSGTSSASPIVTGAIACIQGMAKAGNRAVLTPVEIRDVLRVTGSPQQDAPGRPATQRIGNRPDIRAMAGHVFGQGGTRQGVAFRRAIDQMRPLEIRAFLDAAGRLSSVHDATTLQGGLVSAQSLRAEDAPILDDMCILFRFSSLPGQSVHIVGPVGGGRYLWMGSIDADGLGHVFIDRGFSTTNSHFFDLIAEIQGIEARYIYNDTARRYQPA